MERAKKSSASSRAGLVLPWVAFLQLVLMAGSGLVGVDALRFEVPAAATKCIAEEIQPNVLVLGDYSVVSAGDASHRITVKVTSPYGQQLYFQENVQVGQFGFTTKEGGNFMACFWMQNAPQTLTISLDLDWKTGVAAKDWEDIAKKDKLDGMEVELRKLEEAVESIHAEMLYLRDREKEMRNINEVTNARVAWFSIMSLFICLSVAGWQLWHLKSFFERKKLL
ncbi:p24 family protein delta-1 [Marchantia polymorpha subsp. ruderalis]|uniref:GOLD domain-containing protein n=2 Tax=Marchantia polymorpha TaxID=3197 RepID=A0A176VCE0_MARPO|nr:hypothetical protein AXG93_1923s1340 [Marchantia polymorpha subsp. ruderalis]PTQ48533.1 hypothetical protein MARPO_0005s0169 [Marchantia polymorpha]BBM97274.1 hypothetical protein Mp_1g04380 [Marchantia polymorpha subsp. ruderalis]|eukprot:PTQ48533.1 hypothetical protein MARPO_0005s0169 [Marchantia polymorpha]